MSDEQAQMAINIPDGVRAGVYSDVIVVWHNQWGFTLDFLAQVQPEPVELNGQQVVPGEVVARVRIPPPVIFPLIKALNSNLANYEEKYGTIKEPQSEGET